MVPPSAICTLRLAQASELPSNPSPSLLWAAIIFALIVGLTILARLFQLLSLYARAALSGADVRLLELLAMRLRKVNALTIVNARILANHAKLNISTTDMQMHALAGGDVQKVVLAMVAASKANIDLSWEDATAIDLTGRDVLAEVQTSASQGTSK